MGLPERFANMATFAAEESKVTEHQDVGPARLVMRLEQPTTLGDRHSEIVVTPDILDNGVMEVRDVLLTAYNRLKELLYDKAPETISTDQV